MKGAREYAEYFTTGQYGNLYIVSSKHARGRTFHIQILPEGEKAIPNGPNLCSNENAIEVYGIVSGQPGWTEEYGWLHKGRWEQDFYRLFKSMKMRRKYEDECRMGKSEEIEKKRIERTKQLLSEYRGLGCIHQDPTP